MKRAELFFNAVLVPLDYVMLVLAGIVAYWVRLSDFVASRRPVMFEQSLNAGEYYRLLLLVALFGVLVFALAGLYKIKKNFRSLQEFFLIIAASSAGLVGIVFYLFLFRQVFESRFIVFAAWIFSILFVTGGRVVVRIIEKALLKRYHYGAHRVLIVGNGALASRLKKEIERRPDLGYVVVGFMPTLSIEKIRSFLQNPGADEIILTNPDFDREKVLDLVAFCKENRVIFKFVPNLFQSLATNIEFDTISAIPLIEFKKTPLDGWGRIIKRLLDVFGSIIGLIIFLPVIIFVAIGVKLSSPGPVFYLDFRVGKDKKKFVFFKFRSMRTELCDGELCGTEEGNKALEELISSEENIRKGPLHKIKNDPRRTKFGNFIRRTSLDELPQFWNVLRGDMSLVGPRPHMTQEVKKYEAWHNCVFAIKPGITGLSQVSGRSDLDFDEEVRIDSYYIENWSFLLDFKIILKTILIFVFDRSAR